MKSFESKVAAITGAGSGIGRALAIELGRRRCHLALSDVNEEGLQETVAQARQFDVQITSQTVDVAVREAVYAWADAVVKHHGKANLIFNNAGVALGSTVEKKSHGINDVDTREKFEKTFITRSDKAAKVILDGVQRNQRRVLVGPDARVFDWMVRLLPTVYQRVSVEYSKFSAK